MSIVYGVRRTAGDRQFRFRKAILLGTLLVATVLTGWDHSGFLQAEISQVKAQSRLFQTTPGAHRSRMACKRAGVRVPLAPQFKALNRDFVRGLPASLVATRRRAIRATRPAGAARHLVIRCLIGEFDVQMCAAGN